MTLADHRPICVRASSPVPRAVCFMFFELLHRLICWFLQGRQVELYGRHHVSVALS